MELRGSQTQIVKSSNRTQQSKACTNHRGPSLSSELTTKKWRRHQVMLSSLVPDSTLCILSTMPLPKGVLASPSRAKQPLRGVGDCLIDKDTLCWSNQDVCYNQIDEPRAWTLAVLYIKKLCKCMHLAKPCFLLPSRGALGKAFNPITFGGGAWQDADCRSLTPTQWAMQQSVDCKSLTKNSRGHTTKHGVQVPHPISRGHTTKRGLRVPNPNTRGHATKHEL